MLCWMPPFIGLWSEPHMLFCTLLMGTIAYDASLIIDLRGCKNLQMPSQTNPSQIRGGGGLLAAMPR